MRVAITGANGVLGGFLAERFAEHGVRVTGLGSAGPTSSGVDRWVSGRLDGSSTPAALWANLLDGADACIHCAFDHVPNRYRQGEGTDPQRFWARNLGNTLALLEAAVAHGLARTLLISSRAVYDGYGASAEPPIKLTDDAAPRPTTHYGALKAAEEALATRYSAETALTVSALRATGIYGIRQPLERSKWFALVRNLEAGRPPTPRSATEVHGHDLADAALLVLGRSAEQVGGRVFNCSDVLVTNATLTTLFNQISGTRVAQPEPGAEPRVQLDPRALRTLGWQPRGLAGVEATIRTLLGRD
ncbi:MAG: NAD(P)-dependent oxidoreductase [Pseudomonadota bacterium]